MLGFSIRQDRQRITTHTNPTPSHSSSGMLFSQCLPFVLSTGQPISSLSAVLANAQGFSKLALPLFARCGGSFQVQSQAPCPKLLAQSLSRCSVVAKQHLRISVCSCHVVVVATETSPLASHVAARSRQWYVIWGLTKQILLSHVLMIYDSLSLIEVQLAIRWARVLSPR